MISFSRSVKGGRTRGFDSLRFVMVQHVPLPLVGCKGKVEGFRLHVPSSRLAITCNMQPETCNFQLYPTNLCPCECLYMIWNGRAMVKADAGPPDEILVVAAILGDLTAFDAL